MTQDLDDMFNATAAVEVAPDPEAVLAELKFSEPKEVNTRLGPRLVSNAEPTSAFKRLFSERPKWLRERGFTYSLNKFKGNMQVSLWQLVPEKIQIDRQEAIAMSRAVDADINVPVPEGLSYLGYQKAGIAYGATRPGSLIGDEMGLGKTIQAIGIMNACPEMKKILIVCPASLKLNWHRECQKWLVKKRPILVSDSKLFHPIDGISIINFDILNRHIDAIRCTVWDFLVVDEAHYLKNKKARRTTLVFGSKASRREKEKGMADVPGIQAHKKVFLTGTPICNQPSEIFPLISYLDPVNWGSWWGFSRRYCGAYHNGHGMDYSGATNLGELQDKLRATVMIRRLKKDVLKELPPKRRQVIEFAATGDAKDLVAAERRVYEARDEEMAAMQARVEMAKASDNDDEYREAVEALKTGIAAIFGELSTIRRETVVAKIGMKEIIEHIDDAVENSGKVIIFGHHKDGLRLLADKFGDACVMIVGDTPMAERQVNRDRFQADPTCKVILGSFGAMGVGWTLTASSHVMFIEGDWVPGNLSQAEDRAHRIGQLESVLIQHLVLADSIDAVLLKRVISKQEVIEKALDKTVVPEPEVITSDGRGHSTEGTSRDKLAKEAEMMTSDQRIAAHEAIRMLAAMCDGARGIDGSGFNKIDTRLGKELADLPDLSPKRAALARKIAWKYKGQLDATLVARIQLSPTNHD